MAVKNFAIIAQHQTQRYLINTYLIHDFYLPIEQEFDWMMFIFCSILTAIVTITKDRHRIMHMRGDSSV